MRRRNGLLIIVLLLLFVLLGQARADVECDCPDPENCVCFIQLGDKGKAVSGIVEQLKLKGYLGKIRKTTEFSLDVLEAVKRFQQDNGLDTTGMMDHQTLSLLLQAKLTGQAAEEDDDFICYVPTDGGKKFHPDPHCSNMANPRKMTRRNARALGFEQCRKKGCIEAARNSYNPRFSYETEETTAADDLFISLGTLSFHNNGDESVDRSLPRDTPLLLIGNKNSHVFHKPDCASLPAPENQILLQSWDDAVTSGYRPCNHCFPNQR